jgi:hypothetical protein
MLYQILWLSATSKFSMPSFFDKFILPSVYVYAQQSLYAWQVFIWQVPLARLYKWTILFWQVFFVDRTDRQTFYSGKFFLWQVYYVQKAVIEKIAKMTRADEQIKLVEEL